MSELQATWSNLVDIHSHVLPGMDDGARRLEDSVAIMRASFRQGVRHMWATPHFYPGREDPEAFLTRRNRAAQTLYRGWDPADMPSIYLGAEVAYFYGIGRCGAVNRLCLGDSKYILVEMPPEVWSPDTVDDLLLVRVFLGLRPIIAHVERCIPLQNRRVRRRLVEEGVLFQCNAAFLGMGEEKKRDIQTMLREDTVDLIGSDCHSMGTRRPNMLYGLRGLSCLAGREKVETMLRCARDITRQARCFCSRERTER